MMENTQENIIKFVILDPGELPGFLRKTRRSLGMKLKDVSRKTSLSISFISDLERGVTKPSIETLGKLAMVYGTSIFLHFIGESEQDTVFCGGKQ